MKKTHDHLKVKQKEGLSNYYTSDTVLAYSEGVLDSSQAIFEKVGDLVADIVKEFV